MLVLIFTMAISAHAEATEFIAYKYVFNKFIYMANQTTGTDSRASDNPTLSKMFRISGMLNEYVKAKIIEGKLKNKPVVYDICGFEHQRKRFAFEINEASNAYHISINNTECMFYSNYYIQSELLNIIDYFSSSTYKPIYTDRVKDIDSLITAPRTVLCDSSFRICSVDSILQIHYSKNKYQVFYKNKKLAISLSEPIATPFKYGGRYFLIDANNLWVIKNGKIIFTDAMGYALDPTDTISNLLHVKISSNIIQFQDENGNCLYEYNMIQNTLKDLTD